MAVKRKPSGKMAALNREIPKVQNISILQNGDVRIDFFPLLFSKDVLAWRDGFRPEGSTEENSNGCFDLMFRFWNQTHDLPFYGEIIYWKLK